MNICLIGCGNHTHDVYLPSFNRLKTERDDVTLAACCDLDIEKAKSMQSACGFLNCYTDYREMLKKEKPDALFMVTPYYVTADIAEDAAKLCFCPIMIEKPPGSTLEEALRIKNALGNRLHQVAFNRHFMPSFLALKQKIEASRLQHAEYTMSRINRTEPFFFVTAIHGIDAVRYVVGSDYKHCDFYYQDTPTLGENCYNMHIFAEFENGATAQLAFLVQSGLVTERILATCENVSYELKTPIWHGGDTPGALYTYKQGKLCEKTEFEYQDLFLSNGFYGEMTAFMEAVKTGKQIAHVSMDSALQPVEIAQCLRYRKSEYRK